MPVIKVKLNQIIKMGYKSTYKSEMIQTRLEQGYYDDIVEAGIQGGVFSADTQPTKEELDLKLAQSASGGLPVIFTVPLQDGDLENTYDYIADVLMNPQDYPDIVPNGIPDFAIGLIKTSMNDYGEKSGDFFIECSKAQFSGTPIREYKIYPVKLGSGVNTSSYKVAFVVAGDPAYNSYKVVDFYPSLGAVKFPIVETIELNIDDIEPIPIDLPSFASQYLNSFNLKNIASSMKYKPTDVGLIRVKIMANTADGVEYSTQGGDAFIKVERWTINGSGSFGGEYFPELKDLEGNYPSVTSTLKLTVFQSGGRFKSFDGYVLVSGIKTENNSFVPTFHTVSFGNNDITYPHLGTYNSDNGGEKNLDELKATFETLTKTLFNKIPENSTGIFDLNVGGIGTLIIKAENVIRQMGTSWERGMYYTIMGGTGGYFDFEDYMGLVWVGVSGGTGGNTNAVIWKKNNKMIYPQIASFNWGSVSGDGTLLGSWTVDEFASKLSEQYTTILEALSYTTGGVGLVSVSWGEPMTTFSTYVKVELSSSYTYMNYRQALVATPLVGTNISRLACKIYISSKHNYVVIGKEEMVETGLPKIELVIPGNIDTENFTTATDVYPYIKEQFESLETLMSGKNTVELRVSFEGSSSYWGFFVYKSTSKHSGVSGMETDVYKIEPYTNSFDSNISYEMKYLYMVKSGDELIARVLTYQAGMTDL